MSILSLRLFVAKDEVKPLVSERLHFSDRRDTAINNLAELQLFFV